MTTHKRAWLIPVLYLLSGGLLLGLSVNLAKLASQVGLQPLPYLCWSISGAAMILTVISALRRRLLPVNRRTLEYCGVSALIGVVGPNLIFFLAIPHVGAGFVALIITLPPLLTYAGALALKIERYRIARATGVVAALAGAGVLAAHKLDAPDANTLWILLVMAVPVLMAIGNLYRTLRWPPGITADALAPGMLTVAALVLIMTGLLPSFSLSVSISQNVQWSLIALLAMVFAGQFHVLFLLQKTGGPVLLSMLGSVGAVVGVPIAVLLLGERLPEGLFLGASLISCGVALVSL